MDQLRRRTRLRIEFPQVTGQFLGTLVLRAHGALPGQPAIALYVDNDPGGELPGEQPRAALQGDGLAERGVLQQEPRHGGHEIQPLRHRLDGAG
jgi:hypothetical protein